MSMKRELWRVLLRLRYLFWQRYRHNRLVLEQVGELPLLVLPTVMNPKLFRTGEFLSRQLNGELIGAEMTVLDMGTGTGIGALTAARWAHCVVGVDVNETAVRCAQINVLLNQLENKVTIHHGDLFAPVQGQRFDRILFNPPFFRGTPGDGFSLAWRANDTVERFAAGLSEHLTAVGFALVILSTDGDLPGFLQTFTDNQLQTTIVAQRDMGNEILTIYRLNL